MKIGKWNRVVLFLITLIVACDYRTQASPDNPDGNADTPLQLSTTRSFWYDGIGSGFRKGTHQIGFNGGYAVGTRILGSSKDHDLVLGNVNGGWIVSDIIGKDSCFRGNWEIIAEGFGGVQVNPNDAYLAGLDVFARYNFATGTRFVPFAEIGAGVMATDIGEPDLGSDFQFNEKLGIGVHYFFTEHIAATAEIRLMHISNAGLDEPNLGANSVPLLLGVSYFF